MDKELKKVYEEHYVNKYKVTPEMQRRLFATTQVSVGGHVTDSYIDPAIKADFQTFGAGWLLGKRRGDYLTVVLERIAKTWNGKHDFKEMHKALIVISEMANSTIGRMKE